MCECLQNRIYWQNPQLSTYFMHASMQGTLHSHLHWCLVEEAGWLCRARSSGSKPRYSQVILSILQIRKDILHLCQGYIIINLLYLSYIWYLPCLFSNWWDMPWICWTQSIVYLLYMVYTRHILLLYTIFLVDVLQVDLLEFFLRQYLAWLIPVLWTPLRYLGPEKINLVYPWSRAWCNPQYI